MSRINTILILQMILFFINCNFNNKDQLDQDITPIFKETEKQVTNKLSLYGAVKSKDLSLVVKLLKEGIDPNYSRRTQYPALHLAASMGCTEIMEKLLDSGADIEKKDISYGGTPLHNAAIYGQKSAISMLLKHGANVNALDGSGVSPLHFAAETNKEHDIQERTQKQINQDNQIELTQKIKIIQILLKAGSEINQRDWVGRTPIDYASNNQIKNILMEHGAKSGKDLSICIVS